MSAYDNFENLLAEFSRESGVEFERLENGAAVLSVGDDGATLVNLQLLPESGKLLAWSAVGQLGDDENAAARAEHLLKVNDSGFVESGFTLALDPDSGEVVAHDVRDLEWFDSPDRFAAWLEAAADLVRDVRIQCDELFPFVDDEPLAPVIEEVK